MLLQRSWRSSGNLFRTRDHERAEIGAYLYDNSTSTFVQSQKKERTIKRDSRRRNVP